MHNISQKVFQIELFCLFSFRVFKWLLACLNSVSRPSSHHYYTMQMIWSLSMMIFINNTYNSEVARVMNFINKFCFFARLRKISCRRDDIALFLVKMVSAALHILLFIHVICISWSSDQTNTSNLFLLIDPKPSFH